MTAGLSETLWLIFRRRWSRGRSEARPARSFKKASYPMPHKLRSLKSSGRKVYAQNDEDGTIEAIFQDIPPRSRHFVEFGIGPHWQDPDYIHGIEGNCVFLHKQGWSGVFMDSDQHPEKYSINQEFITPFNINALLRKYKVPQDVDVISIDVDGQDFWIWMALDFHPSLIVIEYNSNFSKIYQSVTIPFDPLFRWDGTKYHGASLGALIKLAADKDYKLVHANGVNAFFIRTDLLANPQDFNDEDILVFVDRHPPDHWQRPWVKI